MTPLLSINWNPDPELFNLFGISIRYYGLLWVIGLAFAYFIVRKEYRDQRIADEKFDTLITLEGRLPADNLKALEEGAMDIGQGKTRIEKL